MLKKFIVLVLILVLVLPTAWSRPLLLQPDHPPLAAELTSRVAARASRLMQDTAADTRLMIPGLQELAAMKKVAETLIMLGQQVIPSIIGEMPNVDLMGSMGTLTTEIPNDAVNKK
ncbi:uncharacterized protein LOC123875347 [Maniola jurtina]|uniref:uncharacterized protein LOC123875347 n=1 Tax=Maniola jurtina TaxID=191418 RepID=UPI001E68E4E4|nr:uncharacterized protein LOC123875347 [Maniola jurtina]